MDIRSSILNFNAQIDTTKMTKSIGSIRTQMEKGIRDSFSIGMKQGLSLKHMDVVRKKMESTAKDIGAIQARMHAQTAKIENSNLNNAFKHLAKVKKQKLADQLDAQSQQLQADMSRIAGISDKIEQMNVDAAKDWKAMAGQSVETFGEGMHSIFSDITSKDVGSMLGVIQKGAAKLQQVRDKAVAQKEAGTGGGMAKMAGIMEKIVPALVGVAALAAGFAAVAKIILDADAQAKGFHKTLMDSGVSVGDLAYGTKNLTGALEEAREAALDLNKNIDWGTTAEDQLKLFGAWTDAGYTMKEMAGNIDTAEGRMNAYRDATSAALTYSNLLGESSDKVAQDMSGMMEQMGLSLQGVQEKFAEIYDAAQMSGFGTKRFFGQVLQATTGMGMYNVRLEQTTSMLLMLNKTLGTKFGPEFFNSLSKGFSEESYTDTWKRIQLVGTKKMMEFAQGAAENTAYGFVDNLSSFFKGGKNEMAKAMEDALGASGGGIAKMLRGGAKTEDVSKTLVSTLANMSPEKQALAIAKLSRSTNDDVSRQLGQLITASKGTTGKEGDLLRASDVWDAGTVLAAKMTETAAVTNKSLAYIGTLTFEEMKGLEGMTDLTREQYNTQVTIANREAGNWLVLKNEQKQMAGMTTDAIKELQAKQIKANGAFVMGNEIFKGKIDEVTGEITKTSGPLKTEFDLFKHAMIKGDETVEKTIDEQTRLAMEMASNTTAMTTYLQMGVEKFLNGIFNATNAILGWLRGDKPNAQEIKNKEAAMKTEEKNRAALMETEKEQRTTLNLLKSKLGPKSTAEDRAKVSDLEKALGITRGKISMSEDTIEKIRAAAGNTFTDRKTAQYSKEARKAALEEFSGVTHTGQRLKAGFKKDAWGNRKSAMIEEQTYKVDQDAARKAMGLQDPETLKKLKAIEEGGGDVTGAIEEWAIDNYKRMASENEKLYQKEKNDDKAAAKKAEDIALKKQPPEIAKAIEHEKQKSALKGLIKSATGIGMSDAMMESLMATGQVPEGMEQYSDAIKSAVAMASMGGMDYGTAGERIMGNEAPEPGPAPFGRKSKFMDKPPVPGAIKDAQGYWTKRNPRTNIVDTWDTEGIKLPGDTGGDSADAETAAFKKWKKALLSASEGTTGGAGVGSQKKSKGVGGYWTTIYNLFGDAQASLRVMEQSDKLSGG